MVRSSLILVAAGFLLLFAACEADKDKSEAPGRYQLVASQDQFIKIDTVSGDTWLYEKSSKKWRAISDSTYTADSL